MATQTENAISKMKKDKKKSSKNKRKKQSLTKKGNSLSSSSSEKEPKRKRIHLDAKKNDGGNEINKKKKKKQKKSKKIKKKKTFSSPNQESKTAMMTPLRHPLATTTREEGEELQGLPLFCNVCHNLLGLPGEDGILRCMHCGNVVLLGEAADSVHLVSESLSAVVASKAAAAEAGDHEDEEAELAKVDDMRCPTCDYHGEMEFYTRQMRSVDEGQTCFYTCPNCGHKFSEDN
mmetsp:Transcript_8487/g.10274  ORF Transcript_8487/g.10274 Transcript_8487/m.10274 type:complete len:233 (-) Transcript_8487:202-900(-)